MAINSYRSDSPKSGRNFSQVFIWQWINNENI
jgi:hypothetical protein